MVSSASFFTTLTFCVSILMRITTRLSPEQIASCQKIYRRGGGLKKVAQYIQSNTGLKRTQAYENARAIVSKIGSSNHPAPSTNIPPEIGRESYSLHNSDGGAVFTFKGAINRVSSLEDLLKKANIDLDKWYVDRYEVNSWEVGRKEKTVTLDFKSGVTNGRVSDTGKIHVEPLFQVKAFLKRKHPIDTSLFFDEFKKSLSKLAPKEFEVQSRRNNGKLLYIPSIPDLHAGKLAWSKETGYRDYDLKIACNEYRKAMADLLSRVDLSQVETILLPIGNDLFNTDNNNQTTGGTPQDEDGRWAKTFTTVWKMIVDEVEKIASITNVKIIIVSGNHDYTKCIYLGETLKAYFSKHPNVSVCNEPTQRKYYVFGENLFMWTHGNNEKMSDLPMIMANERPNDWAKCKRREVMLGHFHHEVVKDNHGVKVRILPSLCPPDFWHSSKGYVMSTQGAQGFLYDLSHGLLATYNYYS
jgi:hypothetical protein